MLVAGDEFMDTQAGRPNVYDQDNETTWLDWDLVNTNADILRFFRLMIAFRKTHPLIARSTGWAADCSWHGTDGDPDLSSSSRSIALHLRGASSGEVDIFAMFNAYWDKLSFSLPVSSNWTRVVDTSMESPFDIIEETTAPTHDSGSYSVGPRSVAVLISSAPALNGAIASFPIAECGALLDMAMARHSE
jgi:glycogen operon protein